MAVSGLETSTGEGRVRVLSGRDRALIWELRPGAAESSFGQAVKGGVDFDGDTWPDLVVSAPGENQDRGAISIYSGATRQRFFRVPGIFPGDELGYTLEIADLDGDGDMEILAGAPMSGSATGSGPGRIFRIDYPSFTGSWVFNAPTGALVGRRIVPFGDWDGDGTREIAVSSPEYHGIGGPRSGRIYLLSGSSGNVLAYWDGRFPEERYGSSLAAGPDLTGDGFGELFVGAPNHLSSGRTVGRVEALNTKNGQFVWSTVGWRDNHVFGVAIGNVYDHDGDGIEDIMAAAPVGLSSLGDDFCTILSSRTGDPLAFIESPASRTGFGEVNVSGLDIDGDGRSDILVGDRLYPDRSNPGEGRFHMFRRDPLDLRCGSTVVVGPNRYVLPLHIERGPNDAGKFYLLMGSASGTEPGVYMGVQGRLPLNLDAYTDTLLSLIASPGYHSLVGRLDTNGSADLSLLIPAGTVTDPLLRGLTLHHAALILDPGLALSGATRAVPLTLFP